MILVDTSVWIEFFRGNPAYFQELSRLIEERKIMALGCVFGELLQGARSEREVKIIEQFWAQLLQINEVDVWIQAGKLSFEGKWHSKGVGLIDLAIVVAARKNQCRIWTLDKKLQSALNPSEVF